MLKMEKREKGLTFITSTDFPCSRDKREGTRSGIERQISVSLYISKDSTETAPLFI